MFYLAVLGNLLIHAGNIPVPGGESLKWFEILSGFVFLNGISPRAINLVAMGGWSIAVETTFYLLVPWLHGRIRSLNTALLFFAISAGAALGLSQYLASNASDILHEQYFAFLWFPVELPVFLLGILTFVLWRDSLLAVRKAISKDRRKSLSLMFLLSSVLIYGGCLPFTDNQLYCSTFAYVPLILGLALYPWPLLVNGVTRFLGKVSYSIYLVHFFVLFLLNKALVRVNGAPTDFARRFIEDKVSGLIGTMMIMLVASVSISVVTWYLVETPGMNLGRKLVKWRAANRDARSR